MAASFVVKYGSGSTAEISLRLPPSKSAGAWSNWVRELQTAVAQATGTAIDSQKLMGRGLWAGPLRATSGLKKLIRKVKKQPGPLSLTLMGSGPRNPDVGGRSGGGTGCARY